jgi:SAM-dependent methyltransferase
MAFKDHFSGHAGAYARYRPDYPLELFAYLASLTARHDVALDCATGSGQAAVGLARHFDLVIASDGSVAQLRSAQQHSRVVYLGNLAEQLALKDASVDLVAAAQAAHWFDHARFHSEARRVLRPDGVLALWTYGLASVTPQIDAVVKDFYANVVGQYWPPERRHVESAYRDLPFPWQEIAAPSFRLDLHWDLDTMLGYVGTWSAVQRYTKVTGADPLPPLREALAACWNSDGRPRSVVWPLYVRVGRPSS